MQSPSYIQSSTLTSSRFLDNVLEQRARLQQVKQVVVNGPMVLGIIVVFEHVDELTRPMGCHVGQNVRQGVVVIHPVVLVVIVQQQIVMQFVQCIFVYVLYKSQN
jgi:hypothetical protein